MGGKSSWNTPCCRTLWNPFSEFLGIYLCQLNVLVERGPQYPEINKFSSHSPKKHLQGIQKINMKTDPKYLYIYFVTLKLQQLRWKGKKKKKKKTAGGSNQMKLESLRLIRSPQQTRRMLYAVYGYCIIINHNHI